MPKYTVKSPLRHDGKDYAPGKPVEMPEEAAERLVADGVLEPAAKPTEKEKK